MKHISNKKIDTKNIKIFTIYFNKSMHVLIFFPNEQFQASITVDYLIQNAYV